MSTFRRVHHNVVPAIQREMNRRNQQEYNFRRQAVFAILCDEGLMVELRLYVKLSTDFFHSGMLQICRILCS